jgi:NitT/TauT family transport system permease protein
MLNAEESRAELAQIRPESGAEPRQFLNARSRLRLVGLATYVATFIALIVIWQLVKVVFNEPSYVLPSPLSVFREIGTFHSLFLSGTWVTAEEVLLGFVLGSAVGVAGGAIVAYSKTAERTIYPAVIAAQSVPKIALAPLFIIWFGFGAMPKIVLAALLAFFPIMINVTAGLKGVDPDLVMMAKASRSSRWKIFCHIQLPLALPSVFAGLKLGITLATTGAIVGEFISGNSGLGSIVEAAQGQQEAAVAFAGIVILSVMSVILFYLLVGIEQLLVRER